MSQEVMKVLRESTWSLHESAENHTFQKALTGGTLGKSSYVAFLEQMLCVHRAVDAGLRRLAANPRYASVISDYHFREPLIKKDLEFFGVEPSTVKPIAETVSLVGWMEDSARDDCAVLGFHYVLEGSTNGSTYIARSVRQAYELTGEAGTYYLDPHGKEQRPRWQAFKAAMDDIGFDDSECMVLGESAQRMFQGMIDISNGLLPTVSADERR
ncbi:MAG: biliverdin-producing heme oxygenase [Planctomycetota bacterium]